MTTPDKLGTRIRTYRERLNMSVEDLAKNAGVEAKLVSRAEEGEVYPPLGILVKLSRALGQRLRCGRTRSSPIIRTG